MSYYSNRRHTMNLTMIMMRGLLLRSMTPGFSQSVTRATVLTHLPDGATWIWPLLHYCVPLLPTCLCGVCSSAVIRSTVTVSRCRPAASSRRLQRRPWRRQLYQLRPRSTDADLRRRHTSSNKSPFTGACHSN